VEIYTKFNQNPSGNVEGPQLNYSFRWTDYHETGPCSTTFLQEILYCNSWTLNICSSWWYVTCMRRDGQRSERSLYLGRSSWTTRKNGTETVVWKRFVSVHGTVD